jgi:uncharacterized protein
MCDYNDSHVQYNENFRQFHLIWTCNRIAPSYNARYNTVMKRRCPVCRKSVDISFPDGKPNTHFPFCSQRCQFIDLGRWLDQRYSVPVETDDSNAANEEDA